MQRRRVHPRLVVAAGLAAIAGACADDPTTTITVSRVDGSSVVDAPPLATARATYRYEGEGRLPIVVESPVRDGTFDLEVPVVETSVALSIAIELHSSSGLEWVGGSPSFRIGDPSAMRVLMGAPGTCERLPGLDLASARSHAAAVLLGHHVVVLGGRDTGGASAAWDAFDLSTLARVPISDVGVPLGVTRAAALGEAGLVAVTETGETFIRRFAPNQPGGALVELSLHAGASDAEDVVAVPYKGVAVVGGGDDVAPSSEVSWVTPGEGLATKLLRDTTTDRAAAGSAVGLWVASWANGMFLLDHVPDVTATFTRRLPFADGVRRGGSLVPAPGGIRLAMLGGVDENDVVRTDAYSIAGCPIACFSTPLPWPTARTGAAILAERVIVGGDGPSDLVEEIVFAPDVVSIEEFARLVVPRANASAIRLPSGPVLVFGGEDAAGPISAAEICFGAPR